MFILFSSAVSSLLRSMGLSFEGWVSDVVDELQVAF